LLRMYVLKKNELNMFRAICNGHMSMADLKGATGVSNISVYRIAQSLASKRLIVIRRDGKRSVISPSSHGHSKALAAYLEGDRRPVEPLVGSRLLVMLSISSYPKDLGRIAKEIRLSNESVRRLAWCLKNYGAVNQERQKVSIPESDISLVRFLKDFSKGASSAILEDMTSMGSVLWNEGLEFIFTARGLDNASGARETGITAMSRRGLEFMSGTKYYHYAYWRPRLRPEDIALHNILVDPYSARSMAYSLLFLMKEGYDPRYLIKQGVAVGIGELAGQMVVYLDGEPVADAHFPDRADLGQLRAQYGVD